MEVDFDDDRASMLVRGLKVQDYFNLPNALHDGKSVPAVVSFATEWRGVKHRRRVRDEANGFRGHFTEDRAAIAWSASESGFTFVSKARAASTSEFAEIGRERNGSFF